MSTVDLIQKLDEILQEYNIDCMDFEFICEIAELSEKEIKKVLENKQCILYLLETYFVSVHDTNRFEIPHRNIDFAKAIVRHGLKRKIENIDILLHIYC